MSSFTRAELRAHISQSGKNIDPNTKNHSVPTSMKKATTFFNDEYLKRHQSVQWQSLFLLQMPTLSQLQKERQWHDLRFAICLITSEVKHAFFSCVAGRIGFCNHVLPLMMKVFLFSFYECKNPTISMTTFLSLKRPAHFNFSSGIVKEVKSLPNQ